MTTNDAADTPDAPEISSRAHKPAARAIRGRKLLVAGPVVALLAWSGLLLFTSVVPPTGVQVIVVVFVLLSLALVATLAPLVYLIRASLPRARGAPFAANHALRESVLLTTGIVFNLWLRLLHSWSIFTALISLGIIVVIEILIGGGQ
jgi:hypothetical protein